MSVNNIASKVAEGETIVVSVVSSLAFPKKHKITKHADYTQCYQAGQRLFSKNFIIFAYKSSQSLEEPNTHFDAQNLELKNWRAGIAITKKYGNAVSRNRLKRLLREFFRLKQDQLPRNYDLVVSPKKHIRTQAFTLEQINNELLPLVKNLSHKLD